MIYAGMAGLLILGNARKSRPQATKDPETRNFAVRREQPRIPVTRGPGRGHGGILHCANELRIRFSGGGTREIANRESARPASHSLLDRPSRGQDGVRRTLTLRPFDWSDDDLEQEVRATLVYRAVTRIDADGVRTLPTRRTSVRRPTAQGSRDTA
jgi:hypothetical protein